MSDLEEDIQTRITMAAGGNVEVGAGPVGDNTNGVKRLQSGQPSANTPSKQAREVRVRHQHSGPAFTKARESDVSAVKASKGKYFKGADFCKEQRKIKELFGPEFLALSLLGGQDPCMSYFILGCCHDKCPQSHTLTAQPDSKTLSEMQSRIKEHSRVLHRFLPRRSGRRSKN